jgi:hypothetical protein
VSEEPTRLRKWISILAPALFAGGVSIIGLFWQADQFEKKFKADQEQAEKGRQQWRTQFDSDQKQWRQKFDADQRNLALTIQTGQEQSVMARAKEFRLKFYERQMDFLVTLSQAAARIAAAKKLADVQEDVERFNQSLVASIPLFGDEELHNLAVQFHREMMKTNPQEPITNERFLVLRNQAHQISKKCGATLAKTFELDQHLFGELPKGK